MKALVVLHGDPPPRRVRQELPAFVVAVDGAAHHLDAWGVTPDVVVGDMDSIHADLLHELEGKGVTIERHDAAKDETDGELGLARAVAAGATEVVATGVTGGRLDQELANLQLLARFAAEGPKVRAVEPAGDLWFVTPRQPVHLDLPVGTLVSVLPMSGDVEGVTMVGGAWTTKSRAMPLGHPFGVSNVVEAPSFRVHVAGGVALVVAPAEPQA